VKYPEFPGHVPDNDTSINGAYHAIHTREDRWKAITALITQRPLSCDEIEVITGWPHQSVSARIRELVLKKKIYATKERRKSRHNVSVRVYDLMVNRRRTVPRQ